jgi:ubiquinone/menaquinone biosynthesis C-methylase UbiE
LQQRFQSTTKEDFDRLATLDSEGWTHNNHYHGLLLQHVPTNCRNALEVGCGTGAFARQLAEQATQVIALDLSPEMIRVAQSRSKQYSNLEFHLADALTWEAADVRFDYIACIATLHHLPQQEMIRKLKLLLKDGGVLAILDLFEPERRVLTKAGVVDATLNVAARLTSVSLRLVHNGRLNPPRAVQAAWQAHGQHDSYPTMKDVRALCDELLPGAMVRRHLLWRYSISWQKL